MNDIILSTQNGEPVVSSRQIAESFGKEHKNVLQAVQNLVAENSAAKPMFYPTTFSNRGKTYLMYLMNRDGFTLLAMGFTGKAALEWKLKYIEAFNEMEKRLREARPLPGAGHTGLQALDLLVQSLHEQQDTMNRLQVNVSSQGAEIEKLKEQTELNREAFGLSTDNWRDNANKVVRQIVFAKAGGVNAVSEDYEAVWNEIYTRMDARGLNMKRRLSNLQKEFPGKKFKKIEVITLANDSKRLINDLRSVLCEMCVYYGVRLSAEQAKTVADIQPDESQTSLFDRTCAPAGRLIGAEVSARG